MKLFAAILLSAASALGAEAPLRYTVSWLGNSFSGASNRWVQNFFIHATVQPDGTVNTWSHWDEGGKKFGVYKDGDVIGNTNLNPNSLAVQDKTGRAWKIEFDYVEPKFHEYDFKPKGITCDGEAVKFPDLFEPMALALANDGQLMVADSQTSPRQQVLFYDISDAKKPKLTRAFGDYGGIACGKSGEVMPTKFWGIRGLGMDAAGSIYVAMSEMGSCLRKFTPDGKLVWELRGDFFADVVSADPTTDALDVWGIQEHYRMDFAKAPGNEAHFVGYSLDRHKYPNDPRGLTFVKQNGEHGLTSPQVVYLNGRRFLFVGGMFASNFINIFRYDEEMAVPSGLILQWGKDLYRTEQKWPPNKPRGASIWRDTNGDGDYQADEFVPNTDRVKPGPFWVDKQGNIWMAYGFFRYDFQGLDPKGNPIYAADKITVLDKPKGMNKIARAVYLDDTDTLIVADEGNDGEYLVFVEEDYKAKVLMYRWKR